MATLLNSWCNWIVTEACGIWEAKNQRYKVDGEENKEENEKEEEAGLVLMNVFFLHFCKS